MSYNAVTINSLKGASVGFDKKSKPDRYSAYCPWAVYCEVPPSLIWGGGEPKKWPYYSSLQFTYTFKTLKQTAKARTLCVYIRAYIVVADLLEKADYW